MSLFTRSRQPPNTDKAATEENLPPGGPPEGTPDDAPAGQDTAASADTGVREDAAAGDDAPVGDDAAAGDDARDDPDQVVAGGGWRDRYPGVARAVAWGTTGLAAVLVLFALVLNEFIGFTPYLLARIPVEGIFGAALLLALPPKARRVAAVLGGVSLGLLTVLQFLDMGFYAVLARPFDLVLDWILFDDAASFLSDSIGRAGGIAAVIGIVVLVLALFVLMALSVVRLTNLMVRHSAAATGTTLVVGSVWVTCAALGVQVAGLPVAARGSAELVHIRAQDVSAGLKDERAFAEEASVDAFGDTPADQLLTGLRGKDVIFAFVESYGRSAVEHPEIASQVGEALAAGTDRLSAAGFSSRSGFLTSPTAGGGSWLAHSTFMSGLWIENEQRYRNVTSSDRLTLTGAFRRADDWRTVGIMPGITRSWPEGRFYGLDNVYDSEHLGYQGPKFSWAPVPDQYSLSAFERLEHGKSGREPLMTEIVLVSSHAPWAPIPEMIGWDEVGDGSVYNAINESGKNPEEVWKEPAQVRTEYARSVEYSMNSLISFVEDYGDEDTVLVVLGDHQPAPVVTGDKASRDVPISIIAHDPAVMDRISGWGWHDGLKPGPKAPVWRMDTFRDRFLTAYGPQVP